MSFKSLGGGGYIWQGDLQKPPGLFRWWRVGGGGGAYTVYSKGLIIGGFF